MTTSKHTPGPWRRWPYAGGTRLSLSVVDAEGAEVALVRGWKGDPDHSDADANLIAAAPDLLAACRLLVNLRHGSSSAEISRAIDDGVAAIAKAER
jgi:hypothetical protein